MGWADIYMPYSYQYIDGYMVIYGLFNLYIYMYVYIKCIYMYALLTNEKSVKTIYSLKRLSTWMMKVKRNHQNVMRINDENKIEKILNYFSKFFFDN